MKTQVKTPVIVVVAIAAIGLVVFFGMKVVGESGGLDHGQIQYTPGKPPWMETDPNKKGPGGLGSHSAAPSPQGAPVGPATVDNKPH